MNQRPANRIHSDTKPVVLSTTNSLEKSIDTEHAHYKSQPTNVQDLEKTNQRIDSLAKLLEKIQQKIEYRHTNAPTNAIQTNQDSPGRSDRNSHQSLNRIEPLRRKEYVPTSVAPESDSHLIAMRDLSNAAAKLAAKLSNKRRKFLFWLKSISGMTALAGCFITIAVSGHLGDSASITGGSLMIVGLGTGFWLYQTKRRQTKCRTYRKTTDRMISPKPTSPSRDS